MNRRPLRFISVISLLVLVLILALWVRSSWVLDGVSQFVAAASARIDFGFRSSRGNIWMSIFVYHAHNSRWELSAPTTFRETNPLLRSLEEMNAQGGPKNHGWYHFGFGAAAYRDDLPMLTDALPPGSSPWQVNILLPHWFAALLASLLPLRWAMIRTRIRRMRETAQCVQCGYDLRASPDRCPECGTPVAPASA